MNREERVLNHNKADVAKIVTRKPSGSEGAEGDIANIMGEWSSLFTT